MEQSATLEVVVGRVGRAHGLRGDVVVEVRTDEPDERFGIGATVRVEGTERELTVVRSRWAKGSLIVAFDEVSDRNGAEDLRGSVLVVDVEADDDPDDPDEFWDRRLRGLTVVDESGIDRGGVKDVLHMPAQDVLVIDVDGDEYMVPFVRQLVPTVDVASGKIVVSSIPGLLDPNAEEAR
ncbi:ribosome maturation factor RimM [Cutibacterium sp. WCA-380-WT-3A]|uniref:Ribosome maturation factor RimM n=1 Tax=Cutibacterium porci TaxID=2605781 RepID=A0A7K0J9F2_9ACTN|nr:ribosome maturation factor RimM [Cutibacterium porci]MSS46443.1 ribosome maturation factor RimM [Cutibacterium porci]